MNSSNSFNICPHCNNSNSLNARFCARCGAKLVVPEEVVVCHKCHTRNNPLANFCRNCGTPLKSGAMTKICPKCGREVASDENVCVCGHSFAQIGYVSPDMTQTAAPVAGITPVAPVPTDVTVSEDNKKTKKEKKAKAKKKYTYKSYTKGSGRAFAIVAAILLLLVGYLAASPAAWHLKFIPDKIDNGVTYVTDGDTITRSYVYDKIVDVVKGVTDIIKNNPKDIPAVFGGIANMILLGFCCLFALTIVIHFLVAFIRIFSGRRSKKANIYMLVMAIITTIVSALAFLWSYKLIPNFDNFFGTFLGWFNPANLGGARVGYIYLYLLPAYYWIFFVFSLIAKRRKQKVTD